MTAVVQTMSLKDLVNRRRLGLLTRFASAQMAVQALGFLAGVVVLRSMEPTQYGYYTLALSMVGMAAVLGELGLAGAVLAQGGRLLAAPSGALPKSQVMGQLVADAEQVRRRLAWLPVLVMMPACAVLLSRQQAPLWQVVALTLLAVATAAIQVQGSMVSSISRLLGQAAFQQKMDLGISLGKLMAFALMAHWMLDATVASIVNCAGAALAVALLFRRLAPVASRPAAVTGEHRRALWLQVRRQAPNSIYFVLSSQVALWLIGTFGSAQQVAEVGALSRLSAMFAVITSVSAALVLPYFARRTASAELTRALLVTNGFFALLLALLLCLGWLAPQTLLWVLGGHYSGLQDELNWMLAAGTLAAWGGMLYSVGCALGWVTPFSLSAPLGMGATVLAALLVDVSTVRGSFIINTATALAGLLAAAGYLAWQVRRRARAGDKPT